VDGTVKLLHVANKRVLMSFVHSKGDAVDVPVTTDVEQAPPIPSPSGMGDQGEDVGGDHDEMWEGRNKEEEVAREEVLTVECVGISATAIKWCASGGMDKTLKVWDMTNGGCRAVCVHQGGVVALRWHAELPLIGTAALDNIMRLWDARAGTCLREFSGHTSMVTSLDMLSVRGEGDDQAVQDVLVSVSDDCTAKVFHYSGNDLVNNP
jgi:hypothetical protein